MPVIIFLYTMAYCQTAVSSDDSPLLSDLHRQIDGCTRCALSTGVTHYVPGMGTEKTDIMIIGEGPGKNEDLKGLPFVGASGKFLDVLLDSIGLSRDRVYITNVVKCRPPENRDPKEEEILACNAWLEAQILLINPKIIVTLGRFSMAKFLPGVTISKVHGQPKRRASDGRIIFPCYHPAVALYNGSMRAVLLEDFTRLATVLSQISS